MPRQYTWSRHRPISKSYVSIRRHPTSVYVGAMATVATPSMGATQSVGDPDSTAGVGPGSTNQTSRIWLYGEGWVVRPSADMSREGSSWAWTERRGWFQFEDSQMDPFPGNRDPPYEADNAWGSFRRRPKIIMEKVGPNDHGGHGKTIVGKMETFQSGTANRQNDLSISESSTCGELRLACGWKNRQSGYCSN